jgi:alpha-tubulin suppressor-like RCC1 family protein
VIRTLFLAATLLVTAGTAAARSQPRSVLGESATRGPSSLAARPQLPRFAQVAAGIGHTCAVSEAGEAWCWGWNSHGELGQGEADDGAARWPLRVRVLDEPVTAIAVGAGHTCVITRTGAAKCWGAVCLGALGDGRSCRDGFEPDALEPVDVIGLDQGVVSLAAGFVSTCAVLADGSARCWGAVPMQPDRPDGLPRAVPGLEGGVAAITGGVINHYCALMTDGTVHCWGANTFGELGDGSGGHEAPAPVPGLQGVRAIAAGTGHTCALLETGALRCWGDNGFGQVGDGTTEQRPTPVEVKGLGGPVRSVTAGGAQTCALLESGLVMCWGRNEAGQLGRGEADGGEPHPVPEPVVGLPGTVVRLTSSLAGHEMTDYMREPETNPVSCCTAGYVCALLSDGSLSCWGANREGQLGDGSRTDRPSPVTPWLPSTTLFLPATCTDTVSGIPPGP